MNTRLLLLILVFPAVLFSQEDKQTIASDTISKKNRWGIDAGFSSLILKKRNFSDGKYDIYRNSFYYQKGIIPTIGLFLITKNNNIHLLSFGYRSYEGFVPNQGGIFDMNVKTTNLIINYQYNYSLNKKKLSQKKPSITPFMGLGVYYNIKNYSVGDYPPAYGGDYYYNLEVESKSNILLLQLSPSIKYMSKKVSVSFDLNLNLSGIAFGDYYYNKDEFFDTSSGFYSNEYSNTNIDEKYTETVLPNKLIKDRFFFNDISLKVGFIF